MLRSQDRSTRLGCEIAEFIDNGRFAPDELVMQMMADRLAQPDCVAGYLLDGFPRTVVQAEGFDDYLQQKSMIIDHVLELFAPEQVLLERLTLRSQTEERLDDTPETIRARFEIYSARTAPVLQFYKSQNLVRRIDASLDSKQVYTSICDVLSS